MSNTFHPVSGEKPTDQEIIRGQTKVIEQQEKEIEEHKGLAYIAKSDLRNKEIDLKQTKDLLLKAEAEREHFRQLSDKTIKESRSLQVQVQDLTKQVEDQAAALSASKAKITDLETEIADDRRHNKGVNKRTKALLEQIILSATIAKEYL